MLEKRAKIFARQNICTPKCLQANTCVMLEFDTMDPYPFWWVDEMVN
jgi:hypothetical protein